MPRTLSLTLLVVALAAAEDVPTIIVTAERGESELTRAPQSVSLVVADDIQNRGGAPLITDWLRDLPGVGVWSGNGGIDGGIVSVRMRGLDQKYTLILIDGVPQADGSSIDGAPRMPMLQIAGLERVEVLKGAQSGLYGSGAVGGVVNYLTASPTKDAQVRVSANAGSFGTLGGEVVATGPIGKDAGYAVAVNGLASKGISATTTDQTGNPDGFEEDAINRFAGRVRVEQQLAGVGTIRLSGSLSDYTQEFDGGFPTNPDDSFSENRFKQYDVGLGGSFGDAKRGIDLDVSMQKSRNESYYVSGDPTIYRSELLYASIRGHMQMPVGFRVSGGVDARRDAAQIDPAPQMGVNNYGVYGSVGWGDERTTIEATGRHDQHEEFGGQQTGRLVAGWFAIPEDLKIRGGISSGFKAPSLYQLYAADPTYLAANPELDPEDASTYEAGVDWYPTLGSVVSLTAFHSEVEDQIDYLDPDGWMGAQLGSYFNSKGTTVSNGFEAGATIEQEATAVVLVRLEGAYTYLEANDPSGRTSPYAPQHAGSARVTFEQPVSGTWRLREGIGARRTTAYYSGYGQTNRVDGATIADAVLGAAWNEQWDIALRIDNLFDEDYTVSAPAAVTYSTAPRSYTLSVTGKF